MAWADSELYQLGSVVAAQQIHKGPLDWGDFIYMYKQFLSEIYLHSGTELIPLFPYLRAGLQKGGGGGSAMAV